MASSSPYNLIFMDVQMPNLNGLESTRLIRQSGYTAPIVALSAYSEDTNIKECLESGMNDFISKPIRRPRLKQVLKNFCSPIPEEGEDESPGREGKGASNGVLRGTSRGRSKGKEADLKSTGKAAARDETPSSTANKADVPSPPAKENEKLGAASAS